MERTKEVDRADSSRGFWAESLVEGDFLPLGRRGEGFPGFAAA